MAVAPKKAPIGPSNPVRMFTDGDLDYIREKYTDGTPVRHIALKLQRSTQAIYKKAGQMGLEREKIHGKAASSVAQALVDVNAHEENVVAMAEGELELYNGVLAKESAHALSLAFANCRASLTAQDLNSALGAAQKADGLFRKAKGLDMPGGGVTQNNFFFSEQRESPVRKAVVVDV